MKSKEKSIDILTKQSIMRLCNEQLYKNLLINILRSKNLNLKVPIREQFQNKFYNEIGSFFVVQTYCYTMNQ